MTDIKNADLPANPTQYQDSCNGELYSDNTGMTKREAFAMAAMQGMSSHPDFYGNSKDFAEVISASSVLLADALLAELEK